MAAVDLYIGPYRSGKTRRLTTKLLENCGQRKLTGALLVVPSSRYRNLAQERIHNQFAAADSENQKNGILGLEITNFYNLCARILKKAGITYKVIPDSVRPAIVSRAMQKLRDVDELDNLKPLSEFKGTFGSVLELIDEFQRAGLSPDDVLRSLQKSAADSSKHIELARIYKQYWQELDSIGFLDNRRLAFAAREYLAGRVDKANLFEFVGVDGFDRFNRLQLDVLNELSKFCGKLIVCFDYLEETADSELKQEYVWKETSYNDLISKFNDASIESFEAETNSDVSIKCIKCVDRFLELEEIVRDIKYDAVNEGLKFEETLLVVPAMRKYKTAIEAAFDDAEVPYFIDDAVPLSTLPVIQYIVKLVTLHKDEYGRSRVVNLIHNYHFNDQKFPLLNQFKREIDNVSLENNLVATKEKWKSLELSDNLKGELFQFFDYLNPPNATATLTEYVSWVEDIVDACLKTPEDQDHEDPVKSWVHDRALLEFRNALGALVQEDLVLSGGESNQKIEYESFTGHMSHVLENSNFRNVPHLKNPITVCSIDLAPNRKFERIYIAGLAEGEFPRRKKAQGFVSLDELKQWSSYGIPMDNPRLHPAFEFGLFQSLVKRGQNKVCLSYPMWDMGGDEILPSFFVSSEDEQYKPEEKAPYRMSSLNPYSLKDFVAGGLARQLKFADLLKFNNPELKEIVNELDDQTSMLIARLHGVLDSNFNGCLEEQVTLGTLKVPLPDKWSVSRLNEFGKCPFRYWVSKVLNLEAHEEPSNEVDRRVLGETYHKALELFYAQVIESKLGSLNDNRSIAKELYDQSCKQALDQLEEKSNVRDYEFWDYQRQEYEFRLARFFEKELERETKDKIGFVPYKVESPFGTDKTEVYEHLDLSDEENQILLRGIVDRIDVAGDPNVSCKVRIVDYKSGSTNISANEAKAGRNIQMPLYMMAAEKFLGKNAQSTNGVYLSVSSGDPIGTVKFKAKEDRDELFDIVKDHVKNNVKKIKQGDFKVAPNGNTVCTSCEHKLVCRISEMSKV